LTVTNGNVGATITASARWQNLLDFIAELATAGGIGFRCVRRNFTTYQPTDRTQQVKFAVELGNVAGFSYTESAPDVNAVYVAGGGEGTARVVRLATSADSINRWGRVEQFRDRRDTTDTVELDQQAQTELADGASKRGFALTPIETESIRFGHTYQLGDRVTVVIDGVPVTDIVREVVITLDAAGETVAPTVGDPSTGPDRPRIFDTVDKLRRRVRQLERN
jgi:hypothetical protein